MAIAILALSCIVIGVGLHFVGLRIAIEARPDLARAMGGVMTQAEQEKMEASYRERLEKIQDKLQSTADEMAQMQKLKDRFMDLATPNAVKSQVPSAGGKGGPLKLDLKNKKHSDNLIDALEDSIQDVNEFKKSVSEIKNSWQKQLTWLSGLPTGTPISGQHSITSGFGLRIDPFTQQMARHEGIDFSAHPGTLILSSGPGVVSRAGWDSQYGNVVEIHHAEGFKTRYAHASQLLVRVGQTVKRGEAIAKVGNTGRSTGPHLHYEVIKAGMNINPVNMFPKQP